MAGQSRLLRLLLLLLLTSLSLAIDADMDDDDLEAEMQAAGMNEDDLEAYLQADMDDDDIDDLQADMHDDNLDMEDDGHHDMSHVYQDLSGNSTKRDALSFAAHVRCTLRNPIRSARMYGYGCHCGFGNSFTQGKRIIDALDRCCYNHDGCYNRVQRSGCWHGSLVPYTFARCRNGVASCGTATISRLSCKWKRCAEQYCQCDAIAANCFRQQQGLYKPQNRNCGKGDIVGRAEQTVSRIWKGFRRVFRRRLIRRRFFRRRLIPIRRRFFRRRLIRFRRRFIRRRVIRFRRRFIRRRVIRFRRRFFRRRFGRRFIRRRFIRRRFIRRRFIRRRFIRRRIFRRRFFGKR